jgi:hypothetical protein
MARGPTRIQLKNKDPRSWQEFVARLLELSSRGLVTKLIGGHQGVRNLIND